MEISFLKTSCLLLSSGVPQLESLGWGLGIQAQSPNLVLLRQYEPGLKLPGSLLKEVGGRKAGENAESQTSTQ